MVGVGIGLFGARLSSRMPLAGVLLGKAIPRALSVLPMMKPGSGFRDVLAFPGLRGTDLALAKFPGDMGFALFSVLLMCYGSPLIPCHLV